MRFFPLIVLIIILVAMVLTVLVMDSQSNPTKVDVTRQPGIVILEKEDIPDCPDSVTEMNTVFHCGSITVDRHFEMIDVEGMKTCLLDGTEYHTMQPGQSASMTYELYRGSDFNDPPSSPPQVQIIRDPSFLHQYETPKSTIQEPYEPDAMHVLFDSDKTLLGYDEFAVIRAMVSVDEDASEKTMLLGLTPYTCSGGAYMPFAIVK